MHVLNKHAIMCIVNVISVSAVDRSTCSVVFACRSSKFSLSRTQSTIALKLSLFLSAPATTPAFGGGEACGVALRSRCSPTLRSHTCSFTLRSHTRSFTLRSRTLALRRRSHILNLRRRRRSLAVRRRGGILGGYAPAPAPAVGFGGQSLLAPQPAAAGFGGGAGGFGGGAGGFGGGAGGFGGGGFGKGGGKGGRF